jgi:acetyl esterase/lipase
MRAFVLWIMMSALVSGAEWVELWSGKAPGAERPPAGSETATGLNFRNVEVPQYWLFKPEKANGTAVVVIPGGGYGVVCADHEGKQVGEWLAQRGVTAVVLKYRVGSPEFGYHFPVPYLDARRAIRTVRSKAAEWGVDPGKVGVMGFSAGGHLTSMCLTMFEDRFEEESTDLVDAISCRPDFGILCYPVIAMGEAYCHGGSQRNLLGKEAPQALVDRCNTANRVTAKTPPVFIVHSADDYVVPLRNGTDFAARCAELKVLVNMAVYSEGGHGYGMTGRGDSAGWTTRLEEWLKARKLME